MFDARTPAPLFNADLLLALFGVVERLIPSLTIAGFDHEPPMHGDNHIGTYGCNADFERLLVDVVCAVNELRRNQEWRIQERRF